MRYLPTLPAIAHGFDSLRYRLRRLARQRLDSQRAGGNAADLSMLRHYAEHFPDTGEAFQKFLRRCDLASLKEPSVKGAGQDVGVVVVPWVATPVPWFAVALGIGLARRGSNVVFIWDDSAFPAPSPRLETQNSWIDRILTDVRPYFQVVRLSREQLEPPQINDDAVLDRLVKLNLLWALRGGTPTESELADAQQTRSHLRETLNRIRGLLARTAFRYLVVPGGVYGTSGLYLHVGREAGMRVATFDSGLGWSVACPDGVVTHQVDVPRAFNALYQQTSPELTEAVEAARAEYDRRSRGKDRMRYQSTRVEPTDSIDGLPRAAILIPLSVEWDSAALGRHHIFQDSTDWLVATVGHLLEATDAPVVIRQHPSERRELERSRFRIAALLGERFGSHPRYRFVSAEEDINTYGLLRGARLVLPYVSTIGIEAAAIGKTVIPAGCPYYGELGFTWNATSRDEYFDLIGRAMAGALPPLPDQARKAWLCFYINAVCYRVFTHFSPQPTDFLKWCRAKPERLFATPEVEDLLIAIDEDRPVPLVRHTRRTAHLAMGSGTE